MRFATRAIHVGQEPDPTTGAVTVPIYQTSTYVQREPGGSAPYVYSRGANPTRAALEKNLASLEGGRFGLSFASGMAAVTNVLMLLKQGDHVVAGNDLYGGVPRLFNRILKNLGLEFSFVEPTKLSEIESAIQPSTRLVWIETPSNPMMKVADIREIARIAHGHGSLLVVDSTFASPYLQRPLELGADVVMHSATKYLGGHSDLLGGVIITNDESLYERLKFTQNTIGAVPGPLDCWLVLRGTKTLALRMQKHSENAMALAKFLEDHPKVKRVLYPGLPSHPQHEIARKQMSAFGGMLSFELKGGFGDCKKLLTRFKVFLLAESLGGVESLIEHPASMTHASMPREDRERSGITDSLIRVSVGIEDVEDLIQDMTQALEEV